MPYPRTRRRVVVLSALTALVVGASMARTPAIANPAAAQTGFTFHVDPTRAERRDGLPGYDGPANRRVVSIVDSDGGRSDFVENELVVSTADGYELGTLLDRSGGTVLKRLDPDLEGAKPQYLVRIDTGRADPAKLGGYLAKLNEGRDKAETFAVTSAAGLGLLATAAREAASGNERVTVGVNWVSRPGTFSTGTTNEAVNGPGGFGDDPGRAYSRNAYEWAHLNSNSIQNIGVTSGWTLLDSVGRLDNQVPIAILDQGFRPQATGDLPPSVQMFSAVDGVAPDQISEQIPWHGTDVASAMAAVPDNFVGAAGPAGPVAKLNLIYTGLDMFGTISGSSARSGPTAR